MKGLRRKILSFFTTLAMTVGLVFAGPLQTDVQAVNHYTVSFDGTVSDNTVTYTVGGTAVVVNISLNNGGITSSWDVSNEKNLVMNGGADFLSSLSGAVTSITNYDASTMEIVLIGANNFNLVLSYNNGVFSRSGVGGIPDGSHFEIRAKNNNPGGGNGGNPPGGSKTATINMSSTDGDWSGRPAARENTYRYRADGETIDWNYQTDQSYRYCIVSIDNGQRADFFDSATGTVSFNPDPNDTTHVNVTIAHNWAYKVDSIRINNVDYTTQIPDVSVRNTFLQNFSFR
ncbi:MAG: hypothetical protein II741_03515, partial [Lachnospiraceae bacterium]|nr:hypothetical protein [Lachnospiraceae bacterium]